MIWTTEFTMKYYSDTMLEHCHSNMTYWVINLDIKNKRFKIRHLKKKCLKIPNKGNNKMTELWTILQRESQRLNQILKQSDAVNQRRDNTMAKKRHKRTNNNLQNITQKTKDRSTRTTLKTGVTSCAPEGYIKGQTVQWP